MGFICAWEGGKRCGFQPAGQFDDGVKTITQPQNEYYAQEQADAILLSCSGRTVSFPGQDGHGTDASVRSYRVGSFEPWQGSPASEVYTIYHADLPGC